VTQPVPIPAAARESGAAPAAQSHIPVTVILAVRNEAANLPRCLAALSGFGEVLVVDSQSTDGTPELAESFGCRVVQFHYRGGWPKKRQWAMDTLPLAHDWVFLLDADEVVTPELAGEIAAAVRRTDVNGYYVGLSMWFLGRALRWGDSSFEKLSLFRRGKGRYECRLADQSAAMADMEVHEHVTVDGPTDRLRAKLIHHNYNDLSRYIQKHDEYSNWESRVLSGLEHARETIPAKLFGTQAQRRRWLKTRFFRLPGSPVLLFLYRYVFRLGFMDGVPGLLYCAFQGIQMFHTKAKIYELARKAPAGGR